MEASDNFEAIGDEPIPTLPGTSRKVGATKRKSSLFHRARMSFVRSGGQRGASMETLRGTNGADFEGKAEKVERGNGTSIGCGCFGSAGSVRFFFILKFYEIDKLLLKMSLYILTRLNNESRTTT